MSRAVFGAVVSALVTTMAGACELCAIYSADNARGSSAGGFLLSISEQFTPYRTPQFEGEEIEVTDPDYLDNSITHIVPTYNFSPKFGVSLNIPLIYNSFKRFDNRYFPTPPSPRPDNERGSEFGLGDLALVARATILQLGQTDFSLNVNVLGGIKFPTGDSSRVEDEVEQTRLYDSLLPPGTPHDPLGHSRSGIHQHNLALGSGSYDGIFGVTMNTRWKRWLFNSQFQYYLRTEGQEFEYGDEIMVSGGPGRYLVVNDDWTLASQFSGYYESEARDRILGQKSDRTGMTAWYLGPVITLTFGDHFAANAGVDVPLRIANRWFQYVPEYRVHGGLSYRF